MDHTLFIPSLSWSAVKLRLQQHAQELQEEVSFVGRELLLNIYLCG